MICTECRNRNHDACPELVRQADPTLGKTEKLGGNLCYCQHFVPEKA